MGHDQLAASIQEQERALRRERIWAEAVARVWRGDTDFLEALRADPKGVLERMGAEFPASLSVQITENTASSMTFVLPTKPRPIAAAERDAVFLYAACPCTVCSTGTD